MPVVYEMSSFGKSLIGLLEAPAKSGCSVWLLLENGQSLQGVPAVVYQDNIAVAVELYAAGELSSIVHVNAIRAASFRLSGGKL